jgi:hypothetical protein
MSIIKTALICAAILFCTCVIPIMIMNHDFDTVKIGEKYLNIRNDENPFEKTIVDTMYVDDVKGDWIKWHYNYKSSDSITYRMEDTGRKRLFLNITNGKVK